MHREFSKSNWANDQDEQIIQTFRSVNSPKILLFGSFARGEADQHSDIDIIIVYPIKKRFLVIQG